MAQKPASKKTAATKSGAAKVAAPQAAAAKTVAAKTVKSRAAKSAAAKPAPSKTTTVAAKSKTAAAAKTKVRPRPGETFKQPARGGSPRNPDHSSGHKGISRVDYLKRNTHGWYVRVPWKGEIHAKFFSDGAHGGKDVALNKAIRYRNRLEKALGKPRTERIIMPSHPRSESGVLGVHRILKEGAPVYEVTWSPEPNMVKRTSVSIRKYGEEEALKKARAIRRQKEKEVFGVPLRVE